MSKTYRVNEIFYSLQGEGHNAGRAAVFVRFSGCNLACPFCDTDFSKYREMSAEEIVRTMTSLIPDIAESHPMVVLTGGEPTLRVDCALIDAIHESGFSFIAMESNGTHEPTRNLDWLTVSPKERVAVKKCNELKILFDGEKPLYSGDISADYYYLQPLDTGDTERNKVITAATVDYIKHHPKWQLSLQMHKIVGIR